MTSLLQFRRATPDDASAAAALGQLTFRQTFTHYEASALEAFFAEHYSAAVFERYANDANCELWLGEIQGQLVANAMWGAYKLPLTPTYRRVVELHRLYVRADCHGHGIGSALMKQALDYARRINAEAMYLGVWEGNTKAQAFYRRCGFAKVGEYDYPPIGNVVDREWIMVKEMEEIK